jgi:hypothetical protein
MVTGFQFSCLLATAQQRTSRHRNSAKAGLYSTQIPSHLANRWRASETKSDENHHHRISRKCGECSDHDGGVTSHINHFLTARSWTGDGIVEHIEYRTSADAQAALLLCCLCKAGFSGEARVGERHTDASSTGVPPPLVMWDAESHHFAFIVGVRGPDKGKSALALPAKATALLLSPGIVLVLTLLGSREKLRPT